MGRLADAVQARLRDRLAESLEEYDWEVERRVGGTPVDVAGVGPDALVAVELEWRRADPADNAAKLLRHLAEGSVDADRVTVVQVFTAYYDLDSGGVSSKRANAEFVGETGATALPGFEYHAVDLDVVPPRGQGSPDERWEAALVEAVERITAVVRRA